MVPEAVLRRRGTSTTWWRSRPASDVDAVHHAAGAAAEGGGDDRAALGAAAAVRRGRGAGAAAAVQLRAHDPGGRRGARGVRAAGVRPNDPLPLLPRPTILYMGGPIGPVAPVLGAGESAAVRRAGTRTRRWARYDDPASERGGCTWRRTTDPQRLGQLQEKFGACGRRTDIGVAAGAGRVLLQRADRGRCRGTTRSSCCRTSWTTATTRRGATPDKYLVTSAFTSTRTRGGGGGGCRTRACRRSIPPDPPDLVADFTPDGGFPLGDARRAGFWFDPDEAEKLFMDSDGVRLYGGAPEREGYALRPGRGRACGWSAGDLRVTETCDGVSGGGPAVHGPVGAVQPAAPARAAGRLADLQPGVHGRVPQLRRGRWRPGCTGSSSNGAQNAREKVYHRLWYEPEYIDEDPLRGRLRAGPAVPGGDAGVHVPVRGHDGQSGGGAGGDEPVRRSRSGRGRTSCRSRSRGRRCCRRAASFGYGLTTFDANFDGEPEAVTVHSEQTLAALPGRAVAEQPPDGAGLPGAGRCAGPELDFDGDGVLDDAGRGRRAAERATRWWCSRWRASSWTWTRHAGRLERDDAGPPGDAGERDARARARRCGSGSRAGDGSSARPESVGLQSLEIGDAAIVDRFQGGIRWWARSRPRADNRNAGTGGRVVRRSWRTWRTSGDRVMVTVGRALGATHSAIDDGAGGARPGAGRSVVPEAVLRGRARVQRGGGHDAGADRTGSRGDFQFITMRTPVPKGNFFNPQDSLFLAGLLPGRTAAGDLGAAALQRRPHDRRDVAQIELVDFANTREYESCVGELAAAGPLTETIVAETSSRDSAASCARSGRRVWWVIRRIRRCFRRSSRGRPTS